MQQLVDQGVSIGQAAELVALTYPTTAGDTFYRGPVTDDPMSPPVGVYGLWNSLRGDQSPLGGTKVSDDARTIAQFLHLDNRDLSRIVYVSGRTDLAITTVAQRTRDAMRRGDYFEPQRVEDDTDVSNVADRVQQSLRQLNGIGDYIASIPLPNFN